METGANADAGPTAETLLQREQGVSPGQLAAWAIRFAACMTGPLTAWPVACACECSDGRTMSLIIHQTPAWPSDRLPFLRITGACGAMDLDGDGDVDLADFARRER